MTRKLFYEDAYRKSFTTSIVAENTDKSGRLYVILQETAFYPTGGGQPHDIGTLNGIRVTDVEETDGEIRHYVDSTVGKIGEPVQGEIDWERRFDHMQQHAGQHLLSAAFDNEYGYKTISFHLGKEEVSIDLDVTDWKEAEIENSEQIVNNIILKNLPIETKWVSSQEAERYPLRKKLAVFDHIRLVIVPEFDYNGCGGTHPQTTGEVIAIKILYLERQKKKLRVHFVCGKRMLKQFTAKQKNIMQLSQLLSAPEEGLSEAVQRLLDKEKQTEKEIGEWKEKLLQYESSELLQKKDHFIVRKVFANRPIQELQKLARLIVRQDEEITVFFAAENENRLQLVCACGELVQVSMKQLAQMILPLIDGKGGGNDFFAQGGGKRLLSGSQIIAKLTEHYKTLSK
ncbi:alanyl-tRNA editing protein [Bacillaceae bacterium Marseille-Q3522]|nr:alanyl-tRNA editing protein [Bacillaceae bacterium Marseille-Q3522]